MKSHPGKQYLPAAEFGWRMGRCRSVRFPLHGELPLGLMAVGDEAGGTLHCCSDSTRTNGLGWVGLILLRGGVGCQTRCL
jgi:hypothetical protein